MRRFPISSAVWIWPPLWPIALLVIGIWLMTFWATWLVFHLAVTVIEVTAYVSVGAPWYYSTFWIVFFLAHLVFYIWAQVKLAQARRERAAVEAHARAAQAAYLQWAWQDHIRRQAEWDDYQKRLNEWHLYNKWQAKQQRRSAKAG
jgi:hypothetical protein